MACIYFSEMTDFPPTCVSSKMMHLFGEIGESLAFLSELYPLLITPNTNDYHMDSSRMHKCKGKVAGIYFNCRTIMMKQHFYAV